MLLFCSSLAVACSCFARLLHALRHTLFLDEKQYEEKGLILDFYLRVFLEAFMHVCLCMCLCVCYTYCVYVIHT